MLDGEYTGCSMDRVRRGHLFSHLLLEENQESTESKEREKGKECDTR